VIHGMEQAPHEVGGQVTADPRDAFDPNDMANMGGLARRMPRTFWTFLIGGLALSGFPLVTAGFWSKDEILAQAYASSPAIFWVLAVAAGMTAFYTMRQICLTFLGQPRTVAAGHASESGPSMTVPLIILAVFAVGLGWVGIPEHFPVIGGAIPNWFHGFVGSAIEIAHAAGHTAEVARGFVWQPLALGLGFALGGLALGWLVYGLKPMRAGETDRVEAAMRRVWLGWLHDVMRDRFYFDELYQATFVRGSILLADLFHRFDRGVVDGLVNLAARFGWATSQASDWLDAHVVDALVDLAGLTGMGLSKASDFLDVRVIDRLVDLTGPATRVLSDVSAFADLKVVDAAVDGVGEAIGAGGRFIRPIQTGKVQNYLLLASLMVLALIVTFFVILFLRI
jgi:NADH-quinone oxidoreductase subunit L